MSKKGDSDSLSLSLFSSLFQCYVGVYPSFISWANDYNWYLWLVYLRIGTLRDILAKFPLLQQKFPVFLSLTWTAYSLLLAGKHGISSSVELMSSRIGNPFSAFWHHFASVSPSPSSCFFTTLGVACITGLYNILVSYSTMAPLSSLTVKEQRRAFPGLKTTSLRFPHQCPRYKLIMGNKLTFKR